MVFFFLLSGLFLGWSFGAKDTANVFGTAVESRMLAFKRAALICAVFVTLGAVLEGSGPSQTLNRLGVVNALGGAFTVALAAAITITIMVKLGIPVATTQTLAGAIIGWNYFAGRLTDFGSLATIASSWLIAPLMGCVFAALLFFIFKRYLDKTKLHLLEQDTYTRYGLIIVGALGAYALGANNIANVVGIFVPVTPFRDIHLPGLGSLSGETQLYVIGALSIVLGIYTYSHKIMKTVGKQLFRLTPITGLIAVIAETIVLALFSSQGLHALFVKMGIPPIPLVPVSASQIIVGSVIGIGIAKGGKNLRLDMLGRISIGWITAPVLAFGFSFISLFIVQNVFEQTVLQPSRYSFDYATLTQMKAHNIDIKKMYMVNGRMFDKEQTIYTKLKNDAKMQRQDILTVIRIAEINEFTVEIAKVRKQHLEEDLTAEQLQALSTLEGRKYRHRWQLKNDLAGLPGWQLYEQPSTTLEKEHNKSLETRLDKLARAFLTK